MYRLTLSLLVVSIGLFGCGRPPVSKPVPLSIAQWQSMPPNRKYSTEALERLKEGNPSLQTPEGWEVFSRTTLAQSRNRDFRRGGRR